MSTAELASAYAALILADDGIDIPVCKLICDLPDILSEKNNLKMAQLTMCTVGRQVEHPHQGRQRS